MQITDRVDHHHNHICATLFNEINARHGMATTFVNLSTIQAVYVAKIVTTIWGVYCVG